MSIKTGRTDYAAFNCEPRLKALLVQKAKAAKQSLSLFLDSLIMELFLNELPPEEPDPRQTTLLEDTKNETV